MPLKQKGLLLWAALGASVGASPAGAQQARSAADPIPVEEAVDFRSFPYATPIVLSPDAGRAAYVVEGPQRTGGYTAPLLDPANEAWTELRTARVTTGEVETVVPPGTSTWGPAWSPDGSRLAFLAASDNGVRLWSWNPATGEASRVSDAEVWTSRLRVSPRWTPDGRQIVIKLLPPGLTMAEMRRRAGLITAAGDTGTEPSDAESRVHPDTATVRVLRAGSGDGGVEGQDEQAVSPSEQLRWRFGGDLAAIDVATGRVTRLTREATPLWWDVAPDGRHLAFFDFEAVAAAEPVLRLRVVPLDGSGPWNAPGLVRQTFASGVSWSPGGGKLAYLSDGDGEDAGLFIVDVDQRTRRRLGPGRPGWSRRFGPVWSADGSNLYFADDDALWRVRVEDGVTVRVVPQATGLAIRSVFAAAGTPDGDPSSWALVGVVDDAGETGFARLEPRSGVVEAIHVASGAVGGRFRTAVSGDGRTVVTVREETRRPPELWRLDHALRPSLQLSQLNPAFRSERLGDDRLLRWQGTDGSWREAYLLLPAGYEPDDAAAEPLPMVVEVYADRSARGYLDTFDRWRQLLASRGYAVLIPEIPLETGATQRGHVEAVLPAVDRAVALGIAAPDRVGVRGHSYGGYGTLALLVETDRFAAAVASAAQGNLFGMYGRVARDGTSRTRYLESGQGGMGVTPWEDRQRYIDNSPVFWLDRVRTPLLLLHGTQDATTPVYLAEEVFAGLRRLGRTVELAEYVGEGHWWGFFSQPNQIDYWTRQLGWFDEYLGTESGGREGAGAE